MALNRRILLSALLGIPVAARAANPWRVRLINGGKTERAFVGGLHVSLDKGWKTYWKSPGVGGIPPDISATGGNLSFFEFALPLPERIPAPEGEAIGYKDEVVFPFYAQPLKDGAPVPLAFSAFLGVCENICIPVRVEQSFVLDPARATAADQALMRTWISRVPQRTFAGAAKVDATAMDVEGKPHLRIQLENAAPDLFILGSPNHYFNAPQWLVPGREALVRVDGAKIATELRGTSIAVTMQAEPVPLEVTVTVV